MARDYPEDRYEGRNNDFRSPPGPYGPPPGHGTHQPSYSMPAMMPMPMMMVPNTMMMDPRNAQSYLNFNPFAGSSDRHRDMFRNPSQEFMNYNQDDQYIKVKNPSYNGATKYEDYPRRNGQRDDPGPFGY